MYNKEKMRENAQKIEYIGKNIKNVLTVNTLYSVHYFKYCKKFDFQGESHDFWELVYIDAGVAGVTAEDREYTLKQGQVIFHKPNEYHSISTVDGFANSVIIGFGSKSKLMDFFKDKILTLNAYEKSLLSAIIEEGAKAYGDTMSEVICPSLPENKSDTIGSDQIIKQNLELLLLSLIKNNQSVKTQKNLPEPVRYEHSENLVQGIKSYVEDNLYGNITLDDIANEFYFSKTYVKTVFRRKTGKSIIKYVIELKIEEGKKLISQGRYSITEIAYKLGFSSLHYFSRLFKLYTRMTPTEYARRIKLDKVL